MHPKHTWNKYFHLQMKWVLIEAFDVTDYSVLTDLSVALLSLCIRSISSTLVFLASLKKNKKQRVQINDT